MSDTVAEATEALNLGLAVIGAGAVTFIGIAWKLSAEEERLDRGRAFLGVLLAAVALALGAAAVLLMAPIARESVLENRGAVSSVLVAYDLIFVLALCLLVGAALTVWRALRYSWRTVLAYRD